MGELNELLGFAAALRDAEAVEPADLSAFATAVHQVADQLDLADLTRLRDAFEQVRARAEAEREAVRLRLEQAGSGRKALKGYGSLRAAKTCQRASMRG